MNLIEDFEKVIGYKFKNKELLEEALTHPSILSKNIKSFNYQRLEFLGDAVLNLVMAEILYNKYSDYKENKLSAIRANLVSKDAINIIGKNLEVNKYIIMSFGEENSGGRENKNNIENVVEAVIGAIYKDSGIESAKNFIKRAWNDLLNNSFIHEKDPKTELQEFLQADRLSPPKYVIVKNAGSSHEPLFTVEITVEDFKPIYGVGKNKKEAEKNAAKNFMKFYKDINQ